MIFTKTLPSSVIFFLHNKLNNSRLDESHNADNAHRSPSVVGPALVATEILLFLLTGEQSGSI